MKRETATAYLGVIMMNKDMIKKDINVYVQKTVIRMSPSLFRELAINTGLFQMDGFSKARVCDTEVTVDMQLPGLSYEILISTGIGYLDGVTQEDTDE